MKTFSEAMHLINETISSEDLDVRWDRSTIEIFKLPSTHKLIDAFISWLRSA